MRNEKKIIDHIWHHKVEDNLDWEFCSGILAQDEVADISPDKLKAMFEQFFLEHTGVAPYTPCPQCGATLLPRRSRYGMFVGCSGYPKCKFMAANTRPYREDNANE